MSTNKHGVSSTDVSEYWTFADKAGMLPADDLTPELVADWRRQHEETTSGSSPILGLMALDVTMSSCWIANKMRGMLAKNGEPVFSSRNVEGMQFTLGRMGVFRARQVWKCAVQFWNDLKKNPRRIMNDEEKATLRKNNKVVAKKRGESATEKKAGKAAPAKKKKASTTNKRRKK